MDEQQEALNQFGKMVTEMIVAFRTTLQPVAKALVDGIASAMTREQDSSHYRQATGLNYDPSRIVHGSLANDDVLLIPERAESLRDA